MLSIFSYICSYESPYLSYVLYISCWLLLHLANTKESAYYLFDFQNIYSNSIHPLLFKSKTIHALFHLLLLIIVFKAITIPLKDSDVLIILRILTVILPCFGLVIDRPLKHTLLVDTAGYETSLLS